MQQIGNLPVCGEVTGKRV